MSQRRFSIRITVLTVMLSLTSLVAAVALALHYSFTLQMAEEAAVEHFFDVAEKTADRAVDLEHRGATFALAIKNSRFTDVPIRIGVDDEKLHPIISQMTQLMHVRDGVFSLFIGKENGHYLEVSNLDAADGLRSIWGAEEEDRWIVVTVSADANQYLKSTRYLDVDLSVRKTNLEESSYRANERPWFKQAGVGDVHRSEPYLFSLVKRLGISYAVKTTEQSVVGSLTLLSSLDRLLENEKYPETSQTFIFDVEGALAAYHVLDSGLNDNEKPVQITTATETTSEKTAQNSTGLPAIKSELPFPKLLNVALEPTSHHRLRNIFINNQEHYAYLAPIQGYSDHKRVEFIAQIVEKKEVLEQYKKQLMFSTLIILCLLTLILPLVFFAVRIIVIPIHRLIEQNNKVANRDYKSVSYVPSAIKELHQLSHSLVSMSECICEYELAQKGLMDAFIKLIAQSIDEKSPYTGGHCERVPKVAFLLAEAACEQKQGPFKDFNFESSDEWREFQVAAWLHDCGKITTPEHIVDKGSKLEAIVNRIHEVRMRFEVLWRDAEIHYWRERVSHPEKLDELQRNLDATKHTIEQDFAFVAACNVGGEFMSDEQIERLERIAKQTWTRYLDSRLGLSPVEEQSLAGVPHTTPEIEYLLADKPEHISERDLGKDKNSGFGFTMQPTPAEQNLGEVYNLSIRSGTLTNEDRYIINEHITSTIRMLETLPLPKELERVPEYAGGHHEAINGKGYPRGLTGSQLSIPAKIMAIADIFEALTASDRPYKKAKSLSQSLSIMKNMVINEHVDKELFKLFVSSGAYKVYAAESLSDAQIDDVDEDLLVSEF